MGRGILFGALWGFLLGGLVLAVASLLGEVPGRGAPQASQLEVPAGSGFDQAGVDVPVVPPSAPQSTSSPTSAPLVTAPDAPIAPTLGGDVTSSASIPQTAIAGDLSSPPSGASDSGVVLQSGTPSANGSGDAVSSPSVEPAPEQSAQPLAPDAPAELEAPDTDTDTSTAMAPETVDPTANAVVSVASEEEGTALDEAAVQETSAANTSQSAAAASAAEDAAAEPVAETEIATAPAEDDEAATPAVRPQASAGGFGNRAQGVTVNRLTDSEQDAQADLDANDEPTEARAILRNARTEDWAGPDDRPLASFVLIDAAGDAALLGALSSFDGPLTFALPASASQAARDSYTNAGHEVVVIADVPEGAKPSDIEVAMESYLRAIPEAVAVLDGTLSGFRGDREVAGTVVDILAASGHGLVTVAQGLDAASQIASQAGVPSGTIYRDLDDEGQNNTVIRRFLDQAAFRAQQEGSVILLGRLQAETISALLIWRQQDRAQRVNLAPLSATLMAR